MANVKQSLRTKKAISPAKLQGAFSSFTDHVSLNMIYEKIYLNIQKVIEMQTVRLNQQMKSSENFEKPIDGLQQKHSILIKFSYRIFI